MINSKSQNSRLLKTISPVFSNSVFKKTVFNNNYDFINNRIEKYMKLNENTEIHTYSDFYAQIYNEMLNSYRNEFIYKNEIVNKIILGKHSLNTTNVFNEFRIGKSIADLVMLNGTSLVFEIKTEYDSPERLLSQIKEYRKTFLKIVIVTHHTMTEKYKSFLVEHKLEKVGLTTLTARNTLTEEIKAKEDSSQLDISYMFKCLRKNEYLGLIKKYFGYTPNVPNTKIFKVCLGLAQEIKPIKFHDLMFYYLKKRELNEKKILSSPNVPFFLKHIAISCNLKKEEIHEVKLFLKKNI